MTYNASRIIIVAMMDFVTKLVVVYLKINFLHQYPIYLQKFVSGMKNIKRIRMNHVKNIQRYHLKQIQLSNIIL